MNTVATWNVAAQSDSVLCQPDSTEMFTFSAAIFPMHQINHSTFDVPP